MNVFRAAWLIAKKDLAIELRTREIVVSTGLFAVLVVVLLSISFFVDDSTSTVVAPGVLWIAIAFSGVLAVGRTWGRERENDALRGLLLAPVSPAAVFIGKAIGTYVFMMIVELALVPLVALLFHVELGDNVPMLAAVSALGTLGFVLTGSLFGAMGVRTRARELMLSVVLFPLVAPALLCAVLATRDLFGGEPITAISDWLRLLGAYDLVVGVAGFYLFGPLVAE